jgi:urease accessory protein
MDTLYPLLQITDSLFPSGAFAHSSGLEGLLAQHARLEAGALPAAVKAIWTAHLLRTDGLLGRAAHRAMAAGDVDRVCVLDRELLAMKLARELREASTATGRTVLAEASALLSDRSLAELHARVEAGDSPGNHAIAFHAVAAAAGIPEAESQVAWGYQTVAQMTAALLRLGMLGHRAAASLIGALAPAVEAGVRNISHLDVEAVSSFAPRLEIASMRHERQYSRLFRS